MTCRQEMMLWTPEKFDDFSVQHNLRKLNSTEKEWWNAKDSQFADFREQMIDQYLRVIADRERFARGCAEDDEEQEEPEEFFDFEPLDVELHEDVETIEEE